jgi:hypothetical protein
LIGINDLSFDNFTRQIMQSRKFNTKIGNLSEQITNYRRENEEEEKKKKKII